MTTTSQCPIIGSQTGRRFALGFLATWIGNRHDADGARTSNPDAPARGIRDSGPLGYHASTPSPQPAGRGTPTFAP